MRTPLVKGEDGKSYIELTNQEDEIERRLNPDTGTETENFWPDAPPQVPPPPLLDLQLVWSNISEGVLISTPDQSDDVADEDIHARNAAILVRELKYYLLASGPRPPAANNSAPKADDNQNDGSNNKKGQKDNNTDGDKDLKETEKQSKESEDSKGEKDSKEDQLLKSVYGASILLKLQFEDREVQKIVPAQDYAQLGQFIADVTQNVETLLSKDPTAAQVVIDGIAFELTPILLARMLDGLETEVDVLQTACFDLLKLCSKYASPKEMHMALVGLMRRVDKTYMQATCYLLYHPLTLLWTETLLRFPKKRHAFLLDFVKWFDKAASAAEGFESIGVNYDGGRGAEQPHLCDGVNDIAINFYSKLAKVQANHCMSDSSLGECVDSLSYALSTFSMSKQKSGAKKVDSGLVTGNKSADGEAVNGTKIASEPALKLEGSEKDKGVSREESKGSEATRESSKCSDADHNSYLAEAKDLVNERTVTLAQGLKLQSAVWNDLATPKGEEDNVPKRFRKGKRASEEVTKKEEDAEFKLYTLLRMMHELGWTNPAMVCQIACRGLLLDLMTEGEHLIRDHIGDDIRKKKEVNHSLYSSGGIGLFVCGWLRCASRLHSEGSVDEGVGYDIDLSGSGFDLLEPEYAFDLALPYLETVIGQSVKASCLAGIITVRALLKRMQGTGFTTMEEVIRVRCGTRAIGREVSILGLAMHMGKALSLMDDPKHRTFVYETLQMVIEMCKHPLARYCVVECLLHESMVTVSAQFVTELKDAIRYSDSIAWDAKEDSNPVSVSWSKLDAVELKSRLIQLVSGLYLTPCRKMLGKVQGIAATVGTYVYVAGSDTRHLKMCEESDTDDVKKEIEKRRKMMRAYLKLGREIVRALAAVAEHDQKNLPGSQMAKESIKEAKTVFRASVQTLNSCVATLSMMESAADKLG